MSEASPTLTRELCELIVAAPLDDAVLAAAKRAIVDGIAVALAGRDHESAPLRRGPRRRVGWGAALELSWAAVC